VSRTIFVSGGTGYLGTALIPELLSGRHNVRALTRPGSHGRLPPGCEVIVGDALKAETFRDSVAACDTLIHLVGTPHPAPWKGEQFRAVDRVSFQASLAAAAGAGISHFVYVSVAQPAPVMKEYIEVRAACEADLRASGLRATVLRPWYVLGPGHWWPLLLRPAYAAAERVPWLAGGAGRLGLVWLRDMVAALHWAVEHPPERWRVLDVPAIRAVRRVGRPAEPSGADACPAPRDRGAFPAPLPGGASAIRATARASGRRGA
jgi:uncharacterized protein YbjT (DUF2867 family)